MSTDAPALVVPESLFYAGTPDEELGNFVLLKLPVEIVRGIRDLLRNTAPANAPEQIDPGLMYDELNHQLQQQPRYDVPE